MLNTLETSLDTTGSYIGRQNIIRQFLTCQPIEDQPLKAYFTKLSSYRIQLDHIDDAITDRDLRRPIFALLPSQYAMISMVLQHRRPLPTPEEAMHDLLEEETPASQTKELGDAYMGAALSTQCGSYRGRGQGRVCGRSGHGGHGWRGGSGGSGDSHESKCTYCKIATHTTYACRKRKCAQEGGNNNECMCFQCGLPGHLKVNCISCKRIKEWWTVKKATATAALATTGDCDVFWLTACAVAAAPKWVIDSGASHHLCNDCSSFSSYKKLSLPVVIELGDNNSVTTTHYGFVNLKQGYLVKALHTPTCRLSLLSINQLDLGRHKNIFREGKCSITSPSSCNLTGKLVNGIHTMVLATALLSSITESRRKRKSDSLLPRVIINKPTIESSESPTITPTSPPASSVLKSRQWHRQLAHLNPTAI